MDQPCITCPITMVEVPAKVGWPTAHPGPLPACFCRHQHMVCTLIRDKNMGCSPLSMLCPHDLGILLCHPWAYPKTHTLLKVRHSMAGSCVLCHSNELL